MPVGLPGADPGELERLRREYESSLSWRLTRPLRAAGRLGRALRPRRAPDGAAQPVPQERFDSLLEHFYGERLAAIDAACAQAPLAESYALFRGLDNDLWALLLTQQYELYPNIRALLPRMPEPDLQELWNGRSGIPLAIQSKSFYTKLCDRYERHGERSLSSAHVLDFGCGWGRLTRYLARDVAPDRLYGCDPVEWILDVCRATGVVGTFARSEFLPEQLPFAKRFDLVFAFSVFTHLSEAAHERCLLALYHSLQPDGILIATVRPPGYLHECQSMHTLLETLRPDEQESLPRYLFVPHSAVPAHPQYRGDGGIDYGETVITMAYLRERWSSHFELLEVSPLLDDPYQVMLTMKRI
jgi:SAM-dependent methyltransferase